MRGLPAGFADLQRAAGNRAVGQLLRAPSIRVRAGSKLSAAELAAVIGGNGNVPAWLRKGLAAKGDALTAGRIAAPKASVAANRNGEGPAGAGPSKVKPRSSG